LMPLFRERQRAFGTSDSLCHVARRAVKDRSRSTGVNET
jgi:hypothetical protein